MTGDQNQDQKGRANRFRWETGDVVIYQSLEEMRRQMAREGRRFIPSRPEPNRNQGRNREGAE